MFANNEKFIEVFRLNRYHFYQPANIAEGYHDSRYLAGTNQEIYASSGATKETLTVLANTLIEITNNELKRETLRTDCATIAQNLLFRLKNPVDEHCAIRQGAIYTFMEYKAADGILKSEDPNKVDPVWQRKKESLAFEHPELYSFFLHTGVGFLPLYAELWSTLTEKYFTEREQTLKMLMPKKIES